MFILDPPQERQQHNKEFRGKQVKEVLKAAAFFAILKASAWFWKPKSN